MKLDKTKSYYLGDLSKEQKDTLREEAGTQEHNRSNLDTFKYMSYRDEYKTWLYGDDPDFESVNALELFDSKENSCTKQGKKESNGKCKFELDFDFIEAMSLRIENETKYEPYNWKLPLNTDELASALLRHSIEVKKGNFDDNGELGHLMAIANNAMFLYYQLKNNK